jgi:hypothetical protein
MCHYSGLPGLMIRGICVFLQLDLLTFMTMQEYDCLYSYCTFHPEQISYVSVCMQ